VVAAYAAIVWIAEGRGASGRAAVVALAVGAALLGTRVLAAVTDAADGPITGRRVRRGRCVAHLDSVLDHPDPGELAQRTVATVSAGLEVPAVRLWLGGRVLAEQAAVVGQPATHRRVAAVLAFLASRD